MNSWAQRRKSYITGSFILIVLGGIFFSYQSTQAGPTCSDGIRNQGEPAVDCGGPCARVCPFEATPLSVLWSRVLRVTEGRYDIAALIENKNSFFGVAVLPYTIKIYDANDILIAEKKGETFANPHQRFVLFLPNIDTGKRIPEHIALELGDFDWRRVKADYVAPTVSVEDKQLSSDPFPRLSATLTNSGLKPLVGLEVIAVLSDIDDNVLAVSRTEVGALARNESKEASFTWPESFGKEAAIIDLYPRVHE